MRVCVYLIVFLGLLCLSIMSVYFSFEVLVMFDACLFMLVVLPFSRWWYYMCLRDCCARCSCLSASLVLVVCVCSRLLVGVHFLLLCSRSRYCCCMCVLDCLLGVSV